MAPRACTVSFVGPSGVRHSVDVTAESLYEAAAQGIAALRKDGWVNPLAPGTEVRVEVREPATVHVVTVGQLRRWANGVAVSPEETLKKRNVKQLVG